MAIQLRRGAYANFDPAKMTPGEPAIVVSGDPNSSDGKSAYVAFAAGDVKRLATHDDIVNEIESSTEEIAEDLSRQFAEDVQDIVNQAQSYANQASQASIAASGSAGSAATKAQEAAESAEEAAETVATIIDDTLTQTGKAADAKVTGDALRDLQNNSGLFLYGAKWDRLTNRLTRLAMAKDITIDTTNFGHFGAINPNYNNPFDAIYPWSEMYQCNVDLTRWRNGDDLKDCVVAIYGDPDFTYKGSDTLFVGRYRPEFWHKSEEDEDGNVYFYISQVEREGFKYSPEAIDGISFAIDDGNGGVTAGADIPLTNISVANIHNRAKNSGFALQDINDIDALNILFFVEYANMNGQNALGDGCSSCYRENDADAISNVSVGNGETTFTITDSAMASVLHVGAQLDIGATRGAVTHKGLLKSYTENGSTYTITLDRELAVSDGMIASVHGFSACEFDLIGQGIGNASGYIGANTKANAWYRGGIAFANRYQYVLGIYRQQNTNHLWICPDGVDPNNYDVLNTSVHEDTGIALPDLATASWQTVGGNAKVITGMSAFLATGESNGNSVSPVGDQQYVPLISTGNTILLFGCAAGSGWSCGFLGGSWNASSGTSSWHPAGRPVLKRFL